MDKRRKEISSNIVNKYILISEMIKSYEKDKENSNYTAIEIILNLKRLSDDMEMYKKALSLEIGNNVSNDDLISYTERPENFSEVVKIIREWQSDQLRKTLGQDKDHYDNLLNTDFDVNEELNNFNLALNNLKDWEKKNNIKYSMDVYLKEILIKKYVDIKISLDKITMYQARQVNLDFANVSKEQNARWFWLYETILVPAATDQKIKVEFDILSLKKKWNIE